MFYLTIIFFLLFCIFVYDVNKFSLGKNVMYLVIFVLFVVMSSLRYRVGGDSMTYEDGYANMPNLGNFMHYVIYENTLEYQPLWLLLIAFCKSINPEFYFFQFVHALFFNTALFIFLKRYSKYEFTILFILFISLLYFYFSFEILRESMAISVFLLNIKNLEKNNWVRYYILATVSFLFHISAVFLFFLPLFKKVKITKKLVVIFLVLSVVLYFFKSVLFDLIMPFLFLESMKNKADVYAERDFSALGFVSFYAIRVLIFLPFLLNREKLTEKAYNWFYASFIIVSILSQYFVGFERLLNYLFIIYLVIVAEVFYKKCSTKKLRLQRNFVMLFTFLHIFFIFDYKLLSTNRFGEHFYSRFYPYETILDPKFIQEREDYYYNEFY